MRNTKRPERWLKLGQVAEILSVHENTVYRELRAGRMTGHKVGGKWWRVSESDLAAWQESQKWSP